MFKKNLKVKVETFEVQIKVTIVTGLLITIFLSTNKLIAQAQTTYPTATPGEPVAVLTIVLRDSIGNPLEGVTCEVLSYGWGLQINEAFAVIARGETDKNGVVAFDDSRWPNAGYRFKFTPTDHVKPAGTYFLPDDQNQYRGYPGAVVGGNTETQRFVLSGSDSVVYNDISKEGQSPAYNRDAVAGLEKPRTTLMDGKDYIATVVAATSTAEARGEPTPTIPPPPSPSPWPGEIQPALTVTPQAVLTAAAATAGANGPVGEGNSPSVSPTTMTIQSTVTAASTVGTTELITQVAIARPDATFTQVSGVITSTSDDSTLSSTNPNNSNNLLVSILLAVFGVVCLVLFWKFQFKIYPLFGIETSQPIRSKNKKVRKSDSRANSVKNLKPVQNSPQLISNDIGEEDEESEAER
ncbi:MAG: hypothetical protein BGO39_15575 [Chloroflexi bacterium 54-19]|nr:MAG: hypothetical protein BGO39_15575 [Chloroflexi bacterium 54-19]